MNTTIEIPDLAAMEMFGRKFGQRLTAGAVIALVGPLGAGKTQLAKAIAEGLETTSQVTSPTFVLIQEYDGRLPIYHFDVYRLQSEKEFLDLGSLEYLNGDGVCIIEWADRIERCLPGNYWHIEIFIVDPSRRRLVISVISDGKLRPDLPVA